MTMFNIVIRRNPTMQLYSLISLHQYSAIPCAKAKVKYRKKKFMNCELVLNIFVTLKTKNLFPRNDEIDPTKNDKKFDAPQLSPAKFTNNISAAK